MPNFFTSKLITPDKAVIEYVDIKGEGTPKLLIPGAGDGLNTVGAFPYPTVLAWMFKRYVKNHRLIIMSRREPVPSGFTVRDFSKDYVWAMNELKLIRLILKQIQVVDPSGNGSQLTILKK